jgi:serine/threonine-protein kinase
MAVVFKASDLELGEPIALKVFTQVVHDAQAEERFKRELRLSRQLSNPHVVRLFDIGSYRGVRYISMELLKGLDLRARMASPIRYREAVEFIIQACAGLQAAHEAGVIHRDFKPENCFITESGLVKVMDFGIAKVQNAPGITTTGIVVGTPAYIAPEQVSNFSSVGFASDLYALGVVAYELFSGRLPFSHPEPLKLLMMHINDAPPPLRTHNKAIPEELERVILKLLEKDPARRFSSAKELAARLEEIRSRLPE